MTGEKQSNLLRVIGAFLISQVLSLLLMYLFSSVSDDYWYTLLLNVLFSLLLNVGVYFAFCKGNALPQKSGSYRQFEPVLYFFAAVLLSSLTAFLTKLILPEAPKNEVIAFDLNYLLYCIYTVILAPAAEEFAFRKLALSRLCCFGNLPAVLTSAMLFGLYHMDLSQLPYTFVLGVVLSLLTIRSGSIIPAVFVHMANNLLSLAVNWSGNFAAFANIAVPILGAVAVAYLAMSKRLVV